MAKRAGRVNGNNAAADGPPPLIFPLRGFDELGRRTPGSAAASVRGDFAELQGFEGSGEKLIAAAFWKAI